MLPAFRERRRAITILTVLVAAAFCSILFACGVGSVSLSVQELFGALGEIIHGSPSTLAATLLELRLGRALSAFVTGATLALAGVMMQALLRNPLADPYVLGVSGGASVGALSAMLFFSVAWLVDVAAFTGAIAVAFLLFVLAWRDLRGSTGDSNAPMLLLTGVIVASGCGALVTLMLSIAPDNRLRGMVFWLIGDLSATQSRWLPWIIWLLALTFAVRVARAINVMALHAEAAATLGIRVTRLRQGLFLFSALLTASAVSTAGSIGFVGLIVPHACRFAWGPDHRLLLPAATLAGGTFLVLADTLARSVIAPQQLPVGVITALIGVPVFLLQLHQIHRK
ncbi:FecCD family ABC transporter permease [Noviherbaspirillum denitrificans]|uniref:ABC transporter permease n=1 Tax=Noviherbaspirillum denitrificans TaxID=1968433 RepID=A0A254TB38_9BURK|nr:iron ABC transporter permease [Noviherbaspirillum denitrificans]OWW19844.1 ABC transporter permease [Noviherbaspirillum denitrificans]